MMENTKIIRQGRVCIVRWVLEDITKYVVRIRMELGFHIGYPSFLYDGLLRVFVKVNQNLLQFFFGLRVWSCRCH